MAGNGIGERAVAVGGGRLTMRFRTAGAGPPLVYLHPAAGLHFDPFLEALSADWTVIAPEHPGTSAAPNIGDADAIHAVAPTRTRSTRSTTCGTSSWSTRRRSARSTSKARSSRSASPSAG